MSHLDWHPERVLGSIERSARHAEHRTGELVLERANARVPYRTGELAASGELQDSDEGVAVVYHAEQARYVHAHPEWDFALGRSGHWLEETISESAHEALGRMGDTVRAEWPR